MAAVDAESGLWAALWRLLPHCRRHSPPQAQALRPPRGTSPPPSLHPSPQKVLGRLKEGV